MNDVFGLHKVISKMQNSVCNYIEHKENQF